MNEDETIRRAFVAMERHLAAATEELFGAYGMTLKRVSSEAKRPPRAMEDSVAAVIGYAGRTIRGALVMLSSRDAIRHWQASVGGLDASLDVCDTLCEFTNMLLGGLKGSLLSDGVVILMSTPMAATGRGMSLAPGGGMSTQLIFEGPEWTLRVRLDAAFDEEFGFRPDAVGAAPAVAGDVMLF